MTALVLSMLLCAAGPPWAEEVPAFPDAGAWGVVVHVPYHAQALQAVGVQWVRLGVRWHTVEQGERGRYEWGDADKLIGYYLENGFRVMTILTVEELCPLYEADKDNKDVVIDAIARWMGAMAEHFKGKGVLWELSNEPEVFPMGGYWNHPETYARMARKGAAAIKAADPGAKVGALSIAWMDHDFVTKAMGAGLFDDGTIDVLTYHGYHRHDLLPESGLREDVAWLREEVRAHAPKDKPVVVADSERGYAIVPDLELKPWDNWRNLVYTESEQAAYLARHYLETFAQGVEIAVWYKDMNGERNFSLYYGDENDPRGLRPMGHVYRNLSALLPLNPKRMGNDRYGVSAQSEGADGAVQVRAFVVPRDGEEQLVIAAWLPVEAFDGRILETRARVKDDYQETWRPVSASDRTTVSARIAITGLAEERVIGAGTVDLLATTSGAATPLAMERHDAVLLTAPLTVGPMPVIVQVRVRP